ncbi:MAG: hypothetical protein HY662_00520 [Chloroflexi bacterium]|nr:hypothetical protein [Chloroflexota bacterium]
MRKLYVIPVIHASADMGTLASLLDEASSATLSSELWQIHQETVGGLWDSIGQFVDSLDISGSKIYQDGMAVGGAEGLKIVREATRQGSKNFEIIGRLLEKGGELISAESLALLKQEHSYLSKITASRSLRERATAIIRYKLAKERLLKQRDHFIARKIDETLGNGETGVLFIGAYHDILPNLPGDIKVIQVKDVARVREYHRALLTRKRDDPQIRKLSAYLILPVSRNDLESSCPPAIMSNDGEIQH